MLKGGEHLYTGAMFVSLGPYQAITRVLVIRSFKWQPLLRSLGVLA